MARLTVSTDLIRRLYGLSMGATQADLSELRAELLRLALRAETEENRIAASAAADRMSR